MSPPLPPRLAVQVCFLEGLGEGAQDGGELGLRTAEEPLPGLVLGPGMQGRRISDVRKDASSASQSALWL